MTFFSSFTPAYSWHVIGCVHFSLAIAEVWRRVGSPEVHGEDGKVGEVGQSDASLCLQMFNKNMANYDAKQKSLCKSM